MTITKEDAQQKRVERLERAIRKVNSCKAELVRLVDERAPQWKQDKAQRAFADALHRVNLAEEDVRYRLDTNRQKGYSGMVDTAWDKTEIANRVDTFETHRAAAKAHRAVAKSAKTKAASARPDLKAANDYIIAAGIHAIQAEKHERRL